MSKNSPAAFAALKRHGFKKGQSGNPGGRSKEQKELRVLAREYTDQAVRTLASIMADKKANSGARVSAAQVLIERGWGKPLQQVEVKRTPLDEFTPDELRAVAEALESLTGEAGGSLDGDQGQAGTGQAVGVSTLQ